MVILCSMNKFNYCSWKFYHKQAQNKINANFQVEALGNGENIVQCTVGELYHNLTITTFINEPFHIHITLYF